MAGHSKNGISKPVKSVIIVLALAKNSVDREFFEAYNLMKNYLLSKANDLPFRISGVHEYFSHTFPIDANRNECAAQILEQGHDISIWLDTDQTFQEDAIFKLLSHDYPVVSGMYFVKSEPFHPVVFKQAKSDTEFRLFDSIVQYPQDELFYADMIGMGVCRIDREVLEKLSNPYFKYQEHPVGSVAKDAAFRIKNRIGDVSEDVYFWQQVKEAGYRIVVDPTIQCGHIARLVVDQRAYLGYIETQKQAYIAEHGQEKFENVWSQQCKAENVKKKSSGTTSKSIQPEQTPSIAEPTE